MIPLARRVLAEFLGTALLVSVVVGSGIMAQTLSPHDVGLQLLENSTATVFGLAVLIVTLGPVSGAHFNPVVSAADWWQGRQTGTGLSAGDLGAYAAAQILGAIGGSILANAMFDKPAITWATTGRSAAHLWLGEAVATAGLVLVIFCLTRSGRTALAPAAVAGYIGAAYWFTSSTSFANPAVTVGRVFSDTFAGIAVASVPGFVLAQLAGGVIGLLLVHGLFGRPAARPPSRRNRSSHTPAIADPSPPGHPAGASSHELDNRRKGSTRE
ncbi:MIP/aquaporin family protein [Streptosporangium sp. NPDC000396]|uniref:MIP/aquaporin family protein n=1 Tax=Streptosporangium sp. NPDC000396 TaxID=3366185 RepID=UPI0036BB4491